MNYIVEIDAILDEVHYSGCNYAMILRIYGNWGYDSVIYNCVGCLKWFLAYSICMLWRFLLPNDNMLFITYSFCIGLKINIKNPLNVGEETIIFLKGR